MLATTMPLLARTLPEALVPSLFRFSYTVDELVLLVVLLAGAAVGATRRFSLWSYTWMVLAVVSVVDFFTSFWPSVLFDVIDFGPITLGWLFTATHLLGGLMVLVLAASRASAGLIHTFFVAAIYLVSISLRPYVNFLPDSASPIGMAANAVSVLSTIIMLVVAVAAVMRFLYGDEVTQRRSVYILIIVALLHPILTGWVFLPGSSPPQIANALGIWGLQILARWVYVGVALLITFALILLFAWFRKIKVSSPAPSGGVDG